MLTIDEKKHPSVHSQKKGTSSIFTQAHIGEMMSELEHSITRGLMSADLKDESGSVLGDMRDHLIEVYQRIGLGLLKRQLVYDEQLSKQESEWRATCDKLIDDHQEIK